MLLLVFFLVFALVLEVDKFEVESIFEYLFVRSGKVWR